MPFCEHSLFHERFNHARPAAAAAVWASEGTTLRPGQNRLRLSPRKTCLCQANVLSSPLSSIPRSTQASVQSGWPHQMATSSKVTGASSSKSHLSSPTQTKNNCRSTPASSAARILSRDSFLPPPHTWGPSKKNSPNSLPKLLGLQRSWRPGSKWRIFCQTSNLDFKNMACGKGTPSYRAL